MKHPLSLTQKLLVLPLLAVALSAPVLFAQPSEPPPPPEGREGPGGPGMPGRRPGPPPSPLLLALDADHDGEISAAELANAVAALKTLDKNNDGKLSADEIMPPRRGGGKPPGTPGTPPPPGTPAPAHP